MKSILIILTFFGDMRFQEFSTLQRCEAARVAMMNINPPSYRPFAAKCVLN